MLPMFAARFFWDALRAKNKAAAISAIPAIAPITMPAIAPPLSPFELELVLAFDSFVPAEPAEADAEACEVVDPVGVPDAIEAEGVAVELCMLVLDETWPRTWSSLMTPDLDLQHAVSAPQHHSVLFAVPSQGVILAVSLLHVSNLVVNTG
jgi:hypothetical protein